MKKLIIFIGILTITIAVFPSLKAFIIYEANYDDDSILQLPLAEKDALNLKYALSKIPDSQITLFLQSPRKEL